MAAVRFIFWSVAVFSVLTAALLYWGAELLICDDPLPRKVDAAVVLQGSVQGERVRIAGAAQLLREGKASVFLLSVPRESYWGRPVAPVAGEYIENLYGRETAERLEFCETADVDSTEDEAEAIAQCIAARGWKSIVVVTSNYHTRRAKMIWRARLQQNHSSVQLFIHGVDDPEFHAVGWWRDRRSAKTWITESGKFLWAVF